MALDLVPLSETLGAEVRGVDLARPLAPRTADALLDAWHGHVLLLFRDADLTDEALKRSANWIGAPGEISMPTGAATVIPVSR